MNRQEMTDGLTLDAMLEAMRGAGMASEDFICGYADGFSRTIIYGHWTTGYRRGVRAGDAARERGAHRERVVS